VRLGSASSAIQSRERSSCGASSYSTGPSCGARDAVGRTRGFHCLTVAHVGAPETHSQDTARHTAPSLQKPQWAPLQSVGAQRVMSNITCSQQPLPKQD